MNVCDLFSRFWKFPSRLRRLPLGGIDRVITVRVMADLWLPPTPEFVLATRGCDLRRFSEPADKLIVGIDPQLIEPILQVRRHILVKQAQLGTYRRNPLQDIQVREIRGAA